MRNLFLYLCILCSALSCGRDQSAKIITSLDQLSHSKIGIVTGTTYDVICPKVFPKAQAVHFASITDMYQAVSSGMVDACFTDSAPAQLLMNKQPAYSLLPDVIMEDNYGFAVKPENEVLAQKIDSVIQALMQDHRYQAICDYWLSNKTPDTLLYTYPNDESLPVLLAGTNATSEPFAFHNAANQMIGIDVEILSQVALALGRRLELMDMNFDALIPAVSTGKVEVIGASISITEERKKNVRFSIPYYSNGVRIMVWDESKATSASIEEKTVEDFPIIGVMTGSLAEMYLQKNNPTVETPCYDDIMDAIAALKSHQLDVVMTAYTTAINARRNNPEFIIAKKEYTQEGAAIAFKKGKDTDFLNIINREIRDLKQNGILQEITDRWISPKDGNYTPIDIPQPEGEVLNVGISASREPMCFILNGIHSGLDCELIETIASRIGRRVVYHDMKFSALIPALSSGKVDIVISNLTATAERKLKVDFSDEYFKNPQILLINDSGIVTEKLGFWDTLKSSFTNNIIKEKRYLLILSGIKVTLIISLLSALFGTLLGALICACRMSRNKLLKLFASLYIDLLRGIPQVVLLMLMFYVVFASSSLSGIWVASITFAMNFAAYVSEMFRSSISAISYGQTEAGWAMGFSKGQTFRHIIMPQAIQRVMPVYKGEFISLVKMTSIVGYIAVQDLTKVGDIIRSRTFDAFFPLIVVAIIYFILSWLLGRLLVLIDIKTQPKASKYLKHSSK